MLVLKRKELEWVTIQGPGGAVIRVGVCEVGQKFARIGFEAPPEYSIYRDELLPVIKEVSDAPRHPVDPPVKEAPAQTRPPVDRS